MSPHAPQSAPLRSALAAALLLALPAPALAQKLVLRSELDGSQQVPPTSSTATGRATVIVDLERNTYDFAVTVRGLSSTELYAHAHGFAPPGKSAGILIGLGLGPVKIGTWSFTEGQQDDVLAGLTYLNSHTTSFTNGEIRGQVRLDPTCAGGLSARLDGEQVVPPSGSTANGNGSFAIDTAANTLLFNIDFGGLGSAETGAHIHGPAAPGTNGGVLFTLPAGSPKTGVWNYPETIEADLLDGLTYVSIHTSAFPGGELRGQVLPIELAEPYCTAKANSQGCTPAIGAKGSPTLAGGPDDFVVTCAPVLNQHAGLLFWGTRPDAAPALGGTLCVMPPLVRTLAVGAGGNPPPDDCSGQYAFAFTQAYMASRGLRPGDIVYCQWWSEDPAHPDGTGAGLSDALRFIVQP